MKKRNGLVYAIDFNTQDMPGKIIAVTVALDKVVMRDTDEVRGDLCDHPLYSKLVLYVLANSPSGKGR